MYDTDGSVMLGQRTEEYIITEAFGNNGTFESLTADINLEFGL